MGDVTNKTGRVDVDSKLTVVSSSPTQPGKFLGLNPLDGAMALHTLHVVFYYRANPFLDGPFESDLDNLRVSLSDLLCSYPRVTGRLVRREGDGGDWKVKLNDAGMRTLTAKVRTSLDEWLRSADPLEERDLTVWEDLPADDPSFWSPFQMQISHFECGGIAIGLSCTHMLADLTSATLFFRSWSEVHRQKSITYPPISDLPSSLIIQSTSHCKNPSDHYASDPKLESPSVEMATATFRFSDSVIKQNMAKLQKFCSDATPFDIMVSLFWACVAKMKMPTHSNTHSLNVCLDLRKPHESIIPCGYFGNAINFSVLSLDANTLSGNDGFQHLVGLVHDHIARNEKDHELRLLVRDGLRSPRDDNDYNNDGHRSPPFPMYGHGLTCISMEHKKINSPKEEGCKSEEVWMYSAMFKEEERPLHVSYRVGNVGGEGLILVMPSPEGGFGRTVTVTLPVDQVNKLSEDKEILALQPTMVLSRLGPH